MDNKKMLSDKEQAVGDKPTLEHLDVDYDHRLHCTCNKPVSQGYISILHPDWGAFCRCYISHTQMRMEIRAGRVD
jgi:hypothetical protein